VPEASVAAHLQLADRAGAELHYDEKVLTWTAGSDGVGSALQMAITPRTSW
jgi:hypothetical protein